MPKKTNLSQSPAAIRAREARAKKKAQQEAEGRKPSERRSFGPREKQYAVLEQIGMDDIGELIREGVSYRRIAEDAGVSLGAVSDWLAMDAERYARAKMALAQSADAYAAKAEAVLSDLGKESTKAEQRLGYIPIVG